MNSLISLNKLPIGSTGKIVEINVSGIQRRRMLDLGMIRNTSVKALYKSPSGNPIAYLIRGAVIAFRNEDVEKVIVSLT